MSQSINVIYLLGAGRSGTTLLATLLNNHNDIETLGEMHQFFEFLEDDKDCSCGKSLKTCNEWKTAVSSLTFNASSKRKFVEQEETHLKIPGLLVGKTADRKYLTIQEEVFSKIHKHRPSKWYVDSSKYIARFLLLKKSKKLNIKGIYIVRDPRGVVHSFQKKVQTSKSPLSALLYYNTINLFAEIAYRMDNDILKIRYEDLMDQPEETLSCIYSHIFDKKVEVEKLAQYFEIPHIVGGNRMKVEKRIKLKPDKKWKSLKAYKKTVYYIFALPFSIINNYKF